MCMSGAMKLANYSLSLCSRGLHKAWHTGMLLSSNPPGSLFFSRKMLILLHLLFACHAFAIYWLKIFVGNFFLLNTNIEGTLDLPP